MGDMATVTSAAFSLDTAITNLKETFVQLRTLTGALSYVIGVALVVRGLMMYKIFGSQTMASAQKGEFAGPLVFIIVGAILIYYPSTLDTSLKTLFGTTALKPTNQLMNYASLEKTEQWRDLSDVIVKYIYLIGLIAFIRGWVILSKMGHSGSQPGSIGKGIIHIVGGVLLINIVATVNILAETFGYKG